MTITNKERSKIYCYLLELAPCTDQEFMDAYVEAHEAKYNERFEI